MESGPVYFLTKIIPIFFLSGWTFILFFDTWFSTQKIFLALLGFNGLVDI